MSIDESLATDPFGRFLIKNANEWREIGVQAERERIIKLLEQSLAEYPDAFATHIITLIKEENK